MGSIFVDDIYFTDFLQLACRNDDDNKVENVLIAISRKNKQSGTVIEEVPFSISRSFP